MTFNEKHLLKSNYDDIIFEVTEKVINSSILLKNIFEFTKTAADIPIEIECSATSLKKFIDLIQIQDECKNDEEKYNLQVFQLFKDFTDDFLADFIKEACILDSDILLDALADIILQKIKDMSREEITAYLEIEDDFIDDEREWQNENILEYFISLNDPLFPLQFPLHSSHNFYSMKTKFASPLNILLSRICQRANETITFRLSFCSKALKNECDRHPIKVSRMFVTFLSWCFNISTEKGAKWKIPAKMEYDQYFSAICKRRVMAWNDDIQIYYGHPTFLENRFEVFKKHASSLEWMIPHKNNKTIEVEFSDFEIFVSSFDLTKFKYSHIFFSILFNEKIDFDFFYNYLIAKDLSKKVKLHFPNSSQVLPLLISKKLNAAKFHKCYSLFSPNKEKSLQFIAFLKNYMEPDGRFEFVIPHPTIPEKIIHTCSVKPSIKYMYCFIHDLLHYL